MMSSKFLLLLNSAVILCLSCSPLIQLANAAERKPVSWVNPTLPKGAGLSHHILASKSMGHKVGYVIWTPPGYDNSGNTRYPVVYFLHGMGGTESADSGGFSGLVSSTIKRGQMPPVICVFPNGGRSGYRGNVEKMIVEELIPLIDRTYPTKADTNSRAVAGFSMGGAGAVQLSIMHPDLFCVAASWGGGMWRGKEQLIQSAHENASKLIANRYSVLLVNGDKDRPDAFAPLTAELEASKISHKVVVLPDTPHSLGLYYKRAGTTLTRFIGTRLTNK